ncbi:hypothetical protein ONE63_007801 [Megalurothrips usitatus]|uniref:Protein kinase domain-containing protein n=1 Tax=Megalurothrips usitatus TaxID=439358 RepID=A0AAV7XS60_9NEOP|nr:hypothetical protein ONE63_007801 [Megalurothrips usitatus]
MDHGNWLAVSDQAKDLVRMMLHVDPNRRPTAEQVLNHPWLQQRHQLPHARLAMPGGADIKVGCLVCRVVLCATACVRVLTTDLFICRAPSRPPTRP